MKKQMVRQEFILERKHRASYSDQKLADRIGVDRETVRTVRKEFEGELFTYMGKDFVDFRFDKLMRSIERMEKNWDDLEKQKSKTNETIIKVSDFDRTLGRPLSYWDVKFTRPTSDQMVKIIKEQTKIEDKMQKILTCDLLKVVFSPNDRIESPYKV